MKGLVSVLIFPVLIIASSLVFFSVENSLLILKHQQSFRAGQIKYQEKIIRQIADNSFLPLSKFDYIPDWDQILYNPIICPATIDNQIHFEQKEHLSNLTCNKNDVISPDTKLIGNLHLAQLTLPVPNPQEKNNTQATPWIIKTSGSIQIQTFLVNSTTVLLSAGNIQIESLVAHAPVYILAGGKVNLNSINGHNFVSKYDAFHQQLYDIQRSFLKVFLPITESKIYGLKHN